MQSILKSKLFLSIPRFKTKPQERKNNYDYHKLKSTYDSTNKESNTQVPEYTKENKPIYPIIVKKSNQKINNDNIIYEVTKIFRDTIYGYIKLEDILIQIVDTPEYQRLRMLKQLGATDRVYLGATHTRFEHCLGVAHLADEFIKSLIKNQNNLNITEKDRICVKIAGLCHDLGHGPYSHLFDSMFLPEIYRTRYRKINKTIQINHESSSIKIFQLMIKNNNLNFEKYGLTDIDIIFIEEMISGEVHNRVGRPREKSFLYDIINNSNSGLDVDKLDYFKRDSYYTGIIQEVDFERIFELARVQHVEDTDLLQICFPEKEVYNILKIFKIRFELHNKIYSHKTVKAIEFMLADALLKADQYIKIRGSDNKSSYMSDACEDIQVLANLNDNIISNIMMSDNPNLRESQQLIERIERRQLYKFINRYTLQQHKMCENKICWCKKSTYQLAEDICSYSDNTLVPSDIVVEMVKIHHGMKDRNPINNIYFFKKGNHSCARHIREEEYETHLPRKFMDLSIRLYCKNENHEVHATDAFQKWYESV